MAAIKCPMCERYSIYLEWNKIKDSLQCPKCEWIIQDLQRVFVVYDKPKKCSKMRGLFKIIKE